MVTKTTTVPARTTIPISTTTDGTADIYRRGFANLQTATSAVKAASATHDNTALREAILNWQGVLIGFSSVALTYYPASAQADVPAIRQDIDHFLLSGTEMMEGIDLNNQALINLGQADLAKANTIWHAIGVLSGE